MAYKTWAVGDILTAQDMNQMVRDQVITICTSTTRPAGTARGKFIYETDTGFTRVSNGAGAWYVVAITEGQRPAWEMVGGAPQNIPNAPGEVQYIAGTIIENTNMTSVSASPAQVTIKVPGRYTMSFGVQITDGTLDIYLGNPFLYRKRAAIQVVRGSEFARAMQTILCNNEQDDYVSVSFTTRLNAGDVVKAWMWQNSTETLHVGDSSHNTRFSGAWIGP